MKYKTHSFRNGLVIFEHDKRYQQLWNEIKSVLNSITDSDLMDYFTQNTRTSQKSLSETINKLIDERLSALNWIRQSPIFNDSQYQPSSRNHWWTLDFAKNEIAVEVAFNHGEAVAWNLIKPVLSSELNHVEKAIQTSAGIIITATDSLKHTGNFDSSCGSYEKFLQYLIPFNNILTVPMVIIGLEAPESFCIDSKTKSIRPVATYYHKLI